MNEKRDKLDKLCKDLFKGVIASEAEADSEHVETQQQEVKAEVTKAAVVETAEEKKTVATKKVIRRKTADA